MCLVCYLIAERLTDYNTKFVEACYQNVFKAIVMHTVDKQTVDKKEQDVIVRKLRHRTGQKKVKHNIICTIKV